MYFTILEIMLVLVCICVFGSYALLFLNFRERDTDKNGKLDFQEFYHGLFHLVRNYDDEGYNSSHEYNDLLEGPAKTFFDQLDKDGDGYSTRHLLQYCLGTFS